MKVVFTPLEGAGGRKPIVIPCLPVTVSRLDRERLGMEACTVHELQCGITEDGGLLVVQDLGSRHGTYVNGVRVRRDYLWPGDVLTVGTNSYLVSFDLAKYRSRISRGAEETPQALPAWVALPSSMN
jgi:hypothetical protein